MNLHFHPYLPDTEAFKALWEAAREKWPEKAEDLGFVGHDDEDAYFQIRGNSKKYRLPLDEIGRGESQGHRDE
jgi:hypothetical protein